MDAPEDQGLAQEEATSEAPNAEPAKEEAPATEDGPQAEEKVT